ncbi:MAG TPA: S8 family serine peptidase, partial [Herpetosiphonaceae bacterium]
MEEHNGHDTPQESAGDMPHGEMNAPSSGGGMGAQSSGEMPGGQMEGQESSMEPAGAGGMPGGGMEHGESGESGDQLEQVLVEIRMPRTQAASEAYSMAASFSVPGFQVDTSFPPIPSSTSLGAESASALEEEVVVVRGMIDPRRIPELEAQPNVVGVYKDTPIAPFTTTGVIELESSLVQPVQAAMATCPIGTCDCTPGTAKGVIEDVAHYLGVDQIWAAGYHGEGIVVGVVDGGITALGRTPRPGETAKIPRVIGGWPTTSWGTTASAWGDHGNMCATDVLGMAPQAQIYDIRISDGPFISNALAGFQWAINQRAIDGTPHILTCSFGIFQEGWDPVYATNPSHPFTKKVVEAIDKGIMVLFAAGNCGNTCPDGRCGPDTGPGRSIWGANGHPRVITVGAVNTREQFVGYSSQGPAALDSRKPDFCSITHFKGYFGSDSGTSAATPIAAGVVALLKQGKPDLTQDQAKAGLQQKAKDIGAAGWDQHSGAGIIQAKATFDLLVPKAAWSGWESLGGFCLESPAVASWAPNRLDAFVIGSDSAMYHKWWDGASWNGWEHLGGFCLSSPAAVSWDANRIDTFVIGSDSAMWHKWWDGASWNGWEHLGGFCLHGPAAASWAPNRLDTFVIGSDSALYHKWWDGATWSGWEHLGGFCVSSPAAVSWGANRIDTFVIGSDRALWHKWWDGAGWSGWESLGGFCLNGPAVASWSANRLDVFVIGSDRALWHKWWDGAGWSGWESLGGF